jgi:hypothetical protein
VGIVRGQKEETMSNTDKIRSELKRARTELCQKCGNYRDAHNGACDGCHWKDEWREAMDEDAQK